MIGALRAMALLMSFVPLVGCSSTPPPPPEKYVFDNSRAYDETLDQIWDHLNEYFLVKRFEVTCCSLQNKAHGKIHAKKVLHGPLMDNSDESILSPNGIADCGHPRFGVYMLGTSVSIDVVVVAEGTKTNVTTIAAYEQERNHGSPWVNYNVTVPCTSTGGLEKEILNSL